jgi:dihydropteroate synthase
VVANPPALWGVLNVTPDSFSDGGDFIDADRALERARQMISDGASVIDVGAESTRPGAGRIDASQEISRLTPVVTELVASGIQVSVDTMRAETAQAMIRLGVPIINDVSGGKGDPDMMAVVASSQADYVVMHWRGHSDTMDSLATYDDVVGDVIDEISQQLELAHQAGITRDRLWVDPGLGFAKTAEHNWELCRAMDQFVALGYPVLVGASRKRFLGALLPEGHHPKDRDGVSVALTVALAGSGVAAFRVHEPRMHREALEVWAKTQKTEE